MTNILQHSIKKKERHYCTLFTNTINKAETFIMGYLVGLCGEDCGSLALGLSCFTLPIFNIYLFTTYRVNAVFYRVKDNEFFNDQKSNFYAYWAGSVIGPFVHILAVAHVLLWGLPSSIVGSVVSCSRKPLTFLGFPV